MRWLLDTCTLSETVRSRPDPGVMDWLRRHGHEAAISSASFGEIHYGIASLAPGARPASRMSQNLRAVASPRVER